MRAPMKKYSIAILIVLLIILVFMNPSNQSFKEYEYVQLSNKSGIEKPLLNKYLSTSKTANFILFSFYESSYKGPKEEKEMLGSRDRRIRRGETMKYTLKGDDISMKGKYIGIFGNFFKIN